jgi:uncharacterized protein (TIGR03435 family)
MKFVATFLVSCAAFAQQFEVASIKPADPNSRAMFMRLQPGGRLSLSNMPLKEMIVFAYGIHPFQVTGGPSWIENTRFNVEAKADHTLQREEMTKMLQALLADRFQLVIRKETREMPVYALVVARKDGKLGPGLTEPKACEEIDPSKGPPPPDPNRRGCGNMRMGMGQYTGIAMEIDMLQMPLSRMLQRTVINKTGLTGKYDLTLKWTPDEAQLGTLPPDLPRPTFDQAGPTIFTALQEQLGLKLESQKGPVEMYVIEKAEKPAEN